MLRNLVIVAGLLMFSDSTAVGADERPNIVLIMADDMGYSDIGCYGGEIATPTLDSLADSGVRFTQFYNTGRCCPTRASLLTGLYPHQAGIGHMMEKRLQIGYQGDLNDRCVTIAEVLSESGYATFLSGKWHVTRQTGYWSGNPRLTSKHNWPLQRGFDRFYGTIHGAASFFDPISLTRDNTPIIPEGTEYYYTDAIAERASRFIGDHADGPRGDDPFFCYVAFTAPHWPLHAPEETIVKYQGRYADGWDALRAERYQRMVSLGLIDPSWVLTDRDRSVPAWEDAENKAWQQRRMEVYAAMVDRMDQGIGRIVDTLKQNGQFENTLILFLADNGGCAENLRTPQENRRRSIHTPYRTRDGRPVRPGNDPSIMPGPADTYQSYATPWANASNTPFRLYKHFVHEGGIATPLVVSWPSRLDEVGGQLRRQPGHLIDVMATCVDVADASYPTTVGGVEITPMQGRSLVGAMVDDAPIEREALYWEHEGNRAVRVGDLKLVARGPKGRWELYDLQTDRSETRDLAGEMPETVAKLTRIWTDWALEANVLPWPWKTD